jgi:transposase
MASISQSATGRRVSSRVIVGVDTHKDLHVAVAVSDLGVRLSSTQIATSVIGYQQLEQWATELGHVEAFGVEGTSSFGAGLTRFLRRRGHRVIEVNRPDRATRRRVGKSDPIDAESAARAVLAGVATAVPKTGDGRVEMVRMLKLTKDSATKARVQAIHQIKSLVITAPEPLRDELASLGRAALLQRCADLRPGPLTTPTAVAKHTLRLLARRCRDLAVEIRALRTTIDALIAEITPTLLDTFAVGPDSAATLLITAGDNPHRLHSEAAFAAVCGTNPVPASSGKTNRHRLNRGGDRQANAALHRIAVVRMRWHEPTRAYVTRRRAEGKTTSEILRCLKRYLAREIYHLLSPTTTATRPTLDDL